VGPPVAPPGGGPPPFNTPIPVTPSGDKPPWWKRSALLPVWAWILLVVVVGGGIGAFAATRGGDDDSVSTRTTSADETRPPRTTDADESTLPGGVTLPDGVTLPPGVTLPDGTIPHISLPPISLPDGVTLPPELTTAPGTTIPETTTPDVTDPPATDAPSGDVVPLGTSADVGGGFSVQVNSLDPDATARLTADGSTPGPAPGNVFVTVNMTIGYDGTAGLGYVAVLDFNAVRPPDVTASWYDRIYVTPDDALPIADEIQPGSDVTGSIVFEVPSDAVADLTLQVSSLLTFDGSVVTFALH
jgi:hypothetical protein